MLDKFVCLDRENELRGQRRVYEIGPTCKFFINGKPCDKFALMPGDAIEIDGQPAVKVTATGQRFAAAQAPMPEPVAEETPDATAAGDDGPAADGGAVEQH